MTRTRKLVSRVGFKHQANKISGKKTIFLKAFSGFAKF